MGCASSTPMIQTTGSEMLKAATHVASDATKTAEDAVQGVKDTVGKTLETAKDSVATTVEGVKHEVENVVKEKTEMLEDAKNSLMEKFNLSETKTTENASKNMEHDLETATEMAGELNENLKQDSSDTGSSTMMMATTAAAAATTTTEGSVMENVLTRTDTETDSLKTSTPEPEIEQALANSKNSRHGNDGEGDDGDDNDDNPPTPKPTLSELENLTAEVLQQQQQQQQHQSMVTPTQVNDISMNSHNNNDLLMMITHDNMKSTGEDITKVIQESITPTTTMTTTAASSEHHEQQHHHPSSNSNLMHKNTPATLLPLPIATTAIATATTQARKETEIKQKPQQQLPTPPPSPPPIPLQQPTQTKSKKPKPIKREEAKVLNGSAINNNKNKQSSKANEEKRPGTTEWEKFADMLAQHRKYNPHDGFRRGGTLTKFGGNGHGVVGNGLPLRPSYVGHHLRGHDDDSSDSASNWRNGPMESQRSSARAGGRIQRVSNRPNTGNQRKNHHDINGAVKHASVTRRNSNVGRKFDYNPTRSRLNDSVVTVSSNPYSSSNPSSLQPALNSTQLPYYAPPYESDKSPLKSRSHHSRSETRTPHHLEPLERPRSRSQQHPQPQGSHDDFSQHSLAQQNGSSMPLQSSTNTKYSQFTSETLTRESSNTSLFSNSSYVENLRTTFKSTLDLRPLSTNPPVRNTSSFLTTPRCSPFSVRKSYTDLYFSNSSNKENKKHNFTTDLSSVATQRHLRDKSPYKVRDRCEFCSKKYVIKE